MLNVLEFHRSSWKILNMSQFWVQFFYHILLIIICWNMLEFYEPCYGDKQTHPHTLSLLCQYTYSCILVWRKSCQNNGERLPNMCHLYTSALCALATITCVSRCNYYMISRLVRQHTQFQQCCFNFFPKVLRGTLLCVHLV